MTARSALGRTYFWGCVNMKSVIAGAIAAVLIAVLGAVVLSMLGVSTAELYSTPNVRL